MPPQTASPGGFAWQEFKNDSGEKIPPFSLVRITGLNTEDNGRYTLKIAKSNQYGSQDRHYITDYREVKSGNYGFCTHPRQGIMMAKVENDGSVLAAGAACGPIPDKWGLSAYSGGFTALSFPSPKTALVLWTPLWDVYGTTMADIAKTVSGQVKVSTFNNQTITAGCTWSDIDANTRVLCRVTGFSDLSTPIWEIVDADCS